MLQIDYKFDLNSIKISYEKELEIIRRVYKIIEDVYKNGDNAIVKYTRKYDCPTFGIDDIEVDEKIPEIDEKTANALKEAISRIEKFALFQKENILKEIKVNSCREIFLPIEKVGAYIPGGNAPLFSSVLMTVIPAKVAGVKEIYLATPPDQNKRIFPLILYTAKITGVKKIFRVGGAQAIAGFAFGTEKIPKVDKIVGPGNIYVQIAKKLLNGMVGIDIIAGPSEIVVIADKNANPEFIAYDLIAQAEHGEDSSSILITDSQKLAKRVNELVREILNSFEFVNKNIKKRVESSLKNRGKIYVVKRIEDAFVIANKIAPEHLSLQIKNPDKYLRRVKNAGAVFLGEYSPVALGDYWAGPSHVLPTSGGGRFSSPLGVRDFLKSMSIISFNSKGLMKDLDKITLMADLEGLYFHSKSVKVRSKND